MNAPNRVFQLSGDYPKMTAEARDRVSACLAQGCATLNCPKGTATLKRRVVSASVVIHLQCDGCGRSLSGAMSRKDHNFWQDYPIWDNQLSETFWADRSHQSQRVAAGLSVSVYKERSDLAEQYAAWLRTSPDWARVSRAVHRRSDFVCEACLEASSEVVHHLTYALGALPPAWELRAVCRPCHDRIHADKHSAADPWCPRSQIGSVS